MFTRTGIHSDCGRGFPPGICVLGIDQVGIGIYGPFHDFQLMGGRRRGGEGSGSLWGGFGRRGGGGFEVVVGRVRTSRWGGFEGGCGEGSGVAVAEAA